MSCASAILLPSHSQRQITHARAPKSATIADLGARRRRLRRWADELSRLDDEATKRFQAAEPPIPDEMMVRGLADHVTLDSQWFRPCIYDGRPQSIPTEGWRAMLEDPPRMFGTDEINESALARIRSGLAAAERYDELVRQADEATGYSAARRAYDAALDRVWELDEMILSINAQSVADLMQQAAVLRSHAASPEDCDVPSPMIEALLASIEAMGLANE